LWLIKTENAETSWADPICELNWQLIIHKSVGIITLSNHAPDGVLAFLWPGANYNLAVGTGNCSNLCCAAYSAL